MIINVISTGSSGNLYELLDGKGNSIILEAGAPRATYIKHREGTLPPEMVIITHSHGDHSFYANQYEMMCPVHKWEQRAESTNFKAFGFKSFTEMF
jgi:glyoxylase-like metal-dependent hydrolase (beta-lactamase superfamily II)